LDISGLLKPLYLLIIYRKAIIRERPNVIHLHSSYAGFIGRLASIGLGVRTIYSPHCFAFLRKDISFLKRFVFYFLEWIGARIPTELVAVSKKEMELGRSLGIKKAYVVYNTVSREYYSALRETVQDNTNRTAVVIGGMGRLTNQKNPYLFVKIAHRLRDILPPSVNFCWIGGGVLMESMLQQIDRDKLDIEITGWLSRIHAIQKVMSLNIYVHTALWEAQPIAILEAMAASKPIVSLDFPGVDELISDSVNGYIVNNEDEMVDRVKELVENCDLRDRMGYESKMIFEAQFRSDISLEELRKIYLERK
jgi:glycosyltransferase involved in cell wall biosynthesis